MQPSATTPICNCNTPSSQPAPGTRDRRVALGITGKAPIPGIADLQSAGKERGTRDRRLAVGMETLAERLPTPTNTHQLQSAPNPSKITKSWPGWDRRVVLGITGKAPNPGIAALHSAGKERGTGIAALHSAGKERGTWDRRLAVGREGKGHLGSPTCSRQGRKGAPGIADLQSAWRRSQSVSQLQPTPINSNPPPNQTHHQKKVINYQQTTQTTNQPTT